MQGSVLAGFLDYYNSCFSFIHERFNSKNLEGRRTRINRKSNTRKGQNNQPTTTIIYLQMNQPLKIKTNVYTVNKKRKNKTEKVRRCWWLRAAVLVGDR